MTKSETELGKKIDDLKHQIIIDKLENYCIMLKSAIIELSLNVPSLIYFEHYLKELEKEDNKEKDFIYLMHLLHECALFFYPSSLFERPVGKLDVSDLDKIFTNHSNFISMKDETLRGNFSGLTIMHYNAVKQLDSQIQQVYKDYIKGLHRICQDFGMKIGMDITELFIVRPRKLEVPNLTLDQIDRVFKAVATDGKMKSDQQTAIDFRSLFSQSITEVENKIQWLDVSKNGLPNYSSLYILFETLGVDMNENNKKVICDAFCTNEEPISLGQLRSRAYNNSKANSEFVTLVKKAMM